MSEKKRQKKDGERKDKKNQAMRESESERAQPPGSPQSTRDAAEIAAEQDANNARGNQ
jgi:hypothetical protein